MDLVTLPRMGRPPRAAKGGLIYHVANWSNARLPIFEADAEFEAFEEILVEARERTGMRIFAYCLMPDHWHLVVWPRRDGDLSRFAGWLTLTHTQRWHSRRGTIGTGHLYRGRFKSFPVQEGEYLQGLCRYVERAPLHAGLVRRAETWRWSSLFDAGETGIQLRLLSGSAIHRTPEWTELVDSPTETELGARIELSIQRGRPFGDAEWVAAIVANLGLESTLIPRGRPRKASRKSRSRPSKE
jgi:putative transposase